jgi:hypothetical protein
MTRPKIALALSPENSHCQTLLRLWPFLGGSTYTESPAVIVPLEAAELIIVHLQAPELEAVTTDGQGRPYILIDSKDGCDLGGMARTLLSGDRPPAAIWKKARYADPGLYNRIQGRYQVELIRQEFAGPTIWKVPKPIPPERLGRIKSPFGFGSFAGPVEVLAESVQEYLPSQNRPVDVSFAGTTSYDGSLVERHRRACVEAIRALPAPIKWVCHDSRCLTFPEYCDLLFSSKCVVSPFGWGETCYRDWETVFAGCVLIKPSVKHVDNFPGHVGCNCDFSDLPTAIKKALALPRETVLSWRQKTIAINSPREIGRRLWNDIREAINVGMAIDPRV